MLIIFVLLHDTSGEKICADIYELCLRAKQDAKLMKKMDMPKNGFQKPKKIV